MQVVCCQYEMAWEDKAANYAKVKALIAQERPQSGALVLLPEMSFTGFSMNVDQVCEGAKLEGQGRSESFLAQTALEFDCWLVGGVVRLAPNGRGLNQLVAYSPAGVEMARYSKVQPFTVGTEGQYYTAGEDVVTFQCGECLVAPFICYDLRFPELFRRAAWQRPQLFVVIANWPESRTGHWIKLLQARAIENQAYVAAVNRCGNDPKLAYPGRSLIVNPHGEIMADAGAGEGTIKAELDLQWLEQYRRDLPFLADMREEFVPRGKSAVRSLS